MPYEQEEVIFSNGDVTLAGTLTLPWNSGRHPAVVLLHGSGPLNRDQEAFGMKPFWVIADHLTRKGIAVLRYDSRGVGGSTGAVYRYTISDVAEDALAAVHYLKNRGDIDPAQIGLCGHSQGGAVAPLVASRSEDIAFIICIAPIGLPGDEAHIAQMSSIAKVDGASNQEIEELVGVLKRIMYLIRTETNDAEIRSLVASMIKNQMMSMSQKKGVVSHVDCVMSLYDSPWFRFFIDYDPRPVMEQIECPVLLLFGGLDTQVPAEMHSAAIMNALKKSGSDDYTLEIVPRANHGFQSARTGSPSEYINLKKEFVPGFLEYISDWILERVDIVK